MRALIRNLRISVGVLALVVVAPSVCTAQTTAQECLASQQRFAGKSCRGIAKCYVKAMKQGTAVSAECISKTLVQLVNSAAETELLANCLVDNEAGNVGNQVEAAVDNMANQLMLTGGRCAGRKMGATGKVCNSFMRCSATADAASTTLDPACTSTHADRMIHVFNKIEDSPLTCVTTGDQPTLQAEAQSLADAVQMVFRGTGTTTTTTSTTSSTIP